MSDLATIYLDSNPAMSLSLCVRKLRYEATVQFYDVF